MRSCGVWRAINNTHSAGNFQLLRITKELLTHGEACVCGWQKRNDPAVKQNATHKERKSQRVPGVCPCAGSSAGVSPERPEDGTLLKIMCYTS